MTSDTVCLILYLEATIALEDHRLHWTDKGILSTHTKVEDSCPRTPKASERYPTAFSIFLFGCLIFFSNDVQNLLHCFSSQGMVHGSLHCLGQTPGINLTPFPFCPTSNPSLNPDFHSVLPPSRQHGCQCRHHLLWF